MKSAVRLCWPRLVLLLGEILRVFAVTLALMQALNGCGLKTPPKSSVPDYRPSVEFHTKGRLAVDRLIESDVKERQLLEKKAQQKRLDGERARQKRLGTTPGGPNLDPFSGESTTNASSPSAVPADNKKQDIPSHYP